MIPSWCFEVCTRLEQAGVRYVAVSGTAVVLHGFLRPSADLDLAISPAPDDVTRAMSALMGAGFVPSLPLPMSAVSVMRMFDSAQREVDVFVRYAVPFEELWTSSEQVQVGQCRSGDALDHLLRVKRISARPHNLIDIDGLLALKKNRLVSHPKPASSEPAFSWQSRSACSCSPVTRTPVHQGFECLAQVNIAW